MKSVKKQNYNTKRKPIQTKRGFGNWGMPNFMQHTISWKKKQCSSK